MPDVKRRRRKDNLGGFRRKLGTEGMGITEEDRKRYQFRWVNEENLVTRTEEDDYDVVRRPGRPSKDSAEEGGSVWRKHVGKHEDGSPKYAVLTRKPRELYEEDRRRHDAAVDETMTSIRRGRAGVGADENLYTPEDGVSVRNG